MSEPREIIDSYKADTLRTLADTNRLKAETVNAAAQALQRLAYGASAFILASAAAKLILVSIAFGG